MAASASSSTSQTASSGASAAPVPFAGGHFRTEATGLQEKWAVPGDPAGLAALYEASAPGSYLAAFDAVVAATPAWPFGNFMPNAAIWWGNEPSMLIPWQAAFAPSGAGAPRVAAATRAHLRGFWTTRFDGIPGNDDAGTLSAGALFSLLGLYPLAASDAYVLGSPTFANVSVALASGAARAGGPRLTILAHNASASNVYVAAAALNGARLGSPFVRHADLVAGGGATLELWMTDAPVPW